MVYECETPLVQLKKEIQMIENYIGLEQVRYGKRLNFSIQKRAIIKTKWLHPFY